MNCKGLLVLVLSLGGAIGAAVLWTELDEAKVRGKTTSPVSGRLQPATALVSSSLQTYLRKYGYLNDAADQEDPQYLEQVMEALR